MCPIWRSQVGVHGATQHSNVTRELFLPALSGHSSGVAGPIGFFGVWKFADATDRYVQLQMKVPDDFVSFTSLKVVWIATPASGNMYWKVMCYYAARGEAFDTHSDIPAYGTAASGGANVINVQEPANALTLANLAIGDYIGMKIQRDASHADDTLDAIVYIVGILFTYIAEQ